MQVRLKQHTAPADTSRRLFARMTRLGALAALLFALPFALACGEAGLASGGGSAGSDTASVSIFVTDAPSDDFIAVNLTVTEITLIGGPDGKVSVFEGLETFDLLALRDVSELFAVNDGVAPGQYSKIRLTLADDGLELVVDDGNGAETFHYPKLPGNNKLDLIPRPGLRIGAGEAIGIEIDIDVDKSIHVHANGNGEYRFRPVVFVRVLRNLIDGRLVRLNGWVTDIDVDAQSFSLCRLSRPLAWLHDVRRHGAHPDSADYRAEMAGSGAGLADLEVVDVAGMDERHPWRRCVDVNLTDDASIFDTDGTPIRLGEVTERERATVVGRIRPTRDRPLEMFASLMLMGPPSTFEHRVGVVASELDPNMQFVLELASGAGDLNVQIFPTTKIFERGGMAVGTDAILLDARASVAGVIVFSSSDPAVMNSAVLILDLDDSDPVPLHGDVTSVNLAPGAGECHIGLDIDGVDTGVAVQDRTVIFLIDPDMSGSTIGDLADLAPGDVIDVYGRAGGVDDPCFDARVIVAFPQQP